MEWFAKVDGQSGTEQGLILGEHLSAERIKIPNLSMCLLNRLLFACCGIMAMSAFISVFPCVESRCSKEANQFDCPPFRFF